ncbi:metallophosphoesterase family protein [Acidicapsa ligni]|uniref:metallophosphoesterase family protein n=1 Tax=Acidicapsa ligni TaxID=542300 RepID=UPI0021E0028A|nr:metallophosphoesterase [Acidicapsa ligni]
MTYIKSFHSAPHSLVQSAIAAQLRSSSPATASIGIAEGNQNLQHATEILDRLPHPRLYRSREKALTAASASPLSATNPLSPTCIQLMLEYAWAALRGNQQSMTDVTNEFEKSGCDGTGWLKAAFDYLTAHNWFHNATIPYVASGNTLQLPEQTSFRIGILGDWGTGEPVAQLVLESLMEQKPDLILHVGDVYYAGTRDEMQVNFLNFIKTARAKTGHSAPVFNLDGNHDMYTGGEPFYDALSQVNQGASFPNSPAAPVPTQSASFFTLSNSWLQLQAMDTGYYDSDLWDIGNDTTMLHPAEAAWHVSAIEDAARNSRAVILFSHHQGWSRFLGIGEGHGAAGGSGNTAQMGKLGYNVNLQSELKQVPVGPVKAWFWGHEHVLEVYDQPSIAASTVTTPGNQSVSLSSLFPWVPFGACIGYSAFPMLETDAPYDVAVSSIQSNGNLQVGMTGNPPGYNHGFTVLDIAQGGSATATYFSIAGDGSSPSSTIIGSSQIS